MFGEYSEDDDVVATGMRSVFDNAWKDYVPDPLPPTPPKPKASTPVTWDAGYNDLTFLVDELAYATGGVAPGLQIGYETKKTMDEVAKTGPKPFVPPAPQPKGPDIYYVERPGPDLFKVAAIAGAALFLVMLLK